MHLHEKLVSDVVFLRRQINKVARRIAAALAAWDGVMAFAVALKDATTSLGH
jgi:hypothetical protein